jgi:hypothetical protein
VVANNLVNGSVFAFGTRVKQCIYSYVDIRLDVPPSPQLMQSPAIISNLATTPDGFGIPPSALAMIFPSVMG